MYTVDYTLRSVYGTLHAVFCTQPTVNSLNFQSTLFLHSGLQLTVRTSFEHRLKSILSQIHPLYVKAPFSVIHLFNIGPKVTYRQ